MSVRLSVNLLRYHWLKVWTLRGTKFSSWSCWIGFLAFVQARTNPFRLHHSAIPPQIPSKSNYNKLSSCSTNIAEHYWTMPPLNIAEHYSAMPALNTAEHCKSLPRKKYFRIYFDNSASFVLSSTTPVFHVPIFYTFRGISCQIALRSSRVGSSFYTRISAQFKNHIRITTEQNHRYNQ